MRKQNCSNTPALKDEGRLIYSVVRSRNCKRPNALKHGVFSDAVLIPGEDSGEYKQLLAELMDEWKPAGPTLRDEVIELANLRWKRRRLRKFIQTKLIAAMFDPRCPSFNEAWGLISFTHYLRSEPETCFAQKASSYLRADKINHLTQKFPRSNYQSTSEWVEAVNKEIFKVLLPETAEFDSLEPGKKTEEPGKKAEEMMQASRQWKADCQVAATIMQASELFEYELKQGELLEARIARKIKFLVELKTMEQMLGET
jgi:hypothetical protein